MVKGSVAKGFVARGSGSSPSKLMKQKGVVT